MKSRPRSVEREVAKLLSDFFSDVGMSPVQRIPILGRTGPDITINESNLVIDVKSRLVIPKGYMVTEPTYFNKYYATPLSTLPNLDLSKPRYNNFNSKMIDGYWEHMDQWKREEFPNGITAVILHRPRVAYINSVIVFHRNDFRRFQSIWTQQPN